MDTETALRDLGVGEFTLNRTGDLRRVLHMAYVPRHRKQLTDQRRHLRPETSRRLTPQMKHLLDV